MVRSEARDVDAAVPAADAVVVDAEGAQRRVRRGARRQHVVGGAVEDRERHRGGRLDARVAGAQAGVDGELGVEARDDRDVHDPGEHRGHRSCRAGRRDVDDVVAPLRERVDDRRQRRDADRQARVGGDLDLGHRAEPPVHPGIRADHLDVPSGDAARAQLVDRPCHAVHTAEAVGDEGDARLALARHEPRLLASQERRRRGVRDGRDASLEHRRGRGGQRCDAVARATDRARDGVAQRTLVAAPGPAAQRCVVEVVRLEDLQQVVLPKVVELDGAQPRAEQGAGVLGAEVPARGATAAVALADDPLDHPQDRHRIGCRPGVVAAAERADRERHRGVGPAGGAALLAAGGRQAGADVREERLGVDGGRRLGVGAADVHAGVVVGAADPDAAVRVDVDGGGRVQLGRAGAVARLPDSGRAGRAGGGGAASAAP